MLDLGVQTDYYILGQQITSIYVFEIEYYKFIVYNI